MSETDNADGAMQSATLAAIIARHCGRDGPLLPILHDMMDAFGHIPQSSYDTIAKSLGLTRAEVHGVVSFYHDFREAPTGQHVIKICRAEACQAQGGAAVAEDLLSRLGLEDFGTCADGKVSIEAVYCLGLCACGPAALVDGSPRGRVSAQMLCTEVGQ